MADELATEVGEGECGPAMAVLNERQRAFVRAYIALGRNGYQDNSLAAKEAGYTGSDEHLRVQGHRLSHDPRVMAAILEEAKKGVSVAAAVVGYPVLVEIALDADAPRKDRIKCALALMDRGGIPAMTEHKVSVDHGPNNERMLALAKRFAAELGVDETRLLGVNRDVIDVEFAEVSENG